jgi:hypothetical protein
MRTALLLTLAFAGLTCAAPDELDDAYAALKEAQGKKDPDLVKKQALETSKLAREVVASKQPEDASEVDNWKQRVEYAKEVDTYTEYALSVAALEPIDAAKVMDLVETLIAQNPKSQYLNQCAGVYLAALGKQGLPKQIAGANRLIAGVPNNEDVLFVLVSGPRTAGSLGYANRLMTVLKSKAKPEGVAEADWERKKSTMLGTAQYVAGIIEGEKQAWVDCDKNLRAALPFVSRDQQSAAAAYFYLGLANYQLGKMIGDKAKLQDAVRFSDQSAAIKGPYQATAFNNSILIKKELGTRK